MSNVNSSLQKIQTAFSSIARAYQCSGTIPLKPDISTLFYTRNGRAESIDFTNATDAQLVALAETCQPATFGRDDKDVLDESYRKAGKLDPKEFSVQFSPLSTGVLEIVKQNLLQGRLEGGGTSILVELYKLNVYGPGSFFKAHVDTPRSKTMFGSLVVVLPTAHEGGSLILRQNGKETVFDTAQAVASEDTPHAAFVAFFSDVEHEVAPVTSGYRVTLTYNLSITTPNLEAQALGPELDTTGTSTQQIEELKELLTNLLNDPTFLTEGGFLGFGLSHKYPFKPNSKSPSDLSHIASRLKGSDAEVKRVCQALGLDVSLKALYTENKPGDRNPCCLVNEFVTFYEAVEDVELLEHIFNSCGLKDPLVVYPSGQHPGDAWITEEGKPIVWLRPFSETNSFDTSYVSYGNEATMGYAYGDVCLVAEVQNAEERIAE